MPDSQATEVFIHGRRRKVRLGAKTQRSFGEPASQSHVAYNMAPMPPESSPELLGSDAWCQGIKVSVQCLLGAASDISPLPCEAYSLTLAFPS